MPIKQGQIYYAKVFGNGGRNYNDDGDEWSFDFIPSAETMAEMEAEGVTAKPRNRGDERGDFYTFSKPVLKKDGSAAKPIEIVDRKGKPWPADKAIGNKSTVDIKYLIKEYEYKKKKGLKRAILAIRVLEHIPYEPGDREDFNYGDEWASEDDE